MRLTPDHIQEIGRLVSGRVLTGFPLGRLTSFKIGGPADLVVEPADAAELAGLLRYLQSAGISRMVLGGGSNVLFADAGFRGVVILTASLSGFDVQANGSGCARIEVGAGVPLPVVVKRTCSQGWTGLEPLWGIPGSFGGAAAVNAGAGGISIGDFLQSVRLFSVSGQETLMNKADLTYGYRCMSFPAGSVIVEATLRLSQADRDLIESHLEDARSRRRSSQPLDKPSAGCVFKNPSPENPAGAIIDRLGFIGTTVGGAQVSAVHANFIVNLGNASASDVRELMAKIKVRAREIENVDLEPEIRVVDEEAADV